MRLRSLLLLLCLLAGTATGSRGQSADTLRWTGPYGSVLDDPETLRMGERGLKHLYDMDVAGSRVYIERIEKKHPDHPLGPFLRGLIEWWQILPDLSTGDTSHDRAFFDAMDEVIRRADRLARRDRDSFDALFFKGAALGFRGRLRSNRGEWLRAARDGKDALDLVFRMAERDPRNPDLLFGKGVYDYFAAVIPEQYPMVRPMMYFFPPADKERGLRELEATAAHARFVGTEAAYFLMQIHFQYEPDYGESLRWARELRQRHPANAFFHLIEGRVHARWGRWALAGAIFDDVLARVRAGAPGYSQAIAQQAWYYAGRSDMALGQIDDALDGFNRVEALSGSSPDSYYRIFSRLRAGMALDRLGRRAEAERAYRAVLKMRDRSGAHDRARRYLKNAYR